VTAGTGAARVVDIAALPAGAWTELLTDRDLFLLPGWMRVGPGTYGGGMRQSCAVLAELGGGLVAGTGAWVFDQECTEDLCRPDALMELDPVEGKALFPTVLAGGWYDSRVAHPAGGAAAGDLLAVVAAIEEWGAAQHAATVCWPSVDEREQDLSAILAARGYLKWPLPPRWALEGPWASLDDYFSRLPSKRRISAKHERRVVQDAGITFRDVPLDAGMTAQIVALAHETVTRYGGVVDTRSYAEWVAALAGIPGGQAHVHYAERGGKVVGCVVSSTFAGRTYGLFPGFDYAAISGLPVYFALAYYHLVEFAISNGSRAIEYGPSADEAKRGRGCVAYRQGLWIKGLVPEAAACLTELSTAPDSRSEGSGCDAGR
jgi:uncharacterized protein